MGAVYKKTVTRPLPAGAEIIERKGERLARWKDRRGRTRTAPLTTGKDGTVRIVTESSFYVAKWRDAAGIVQEQSTHCTDETAACRKLGEWEKW